MIKERILEVIKRDSNIVFTPINDLKGTIIHPEIKLPIHIVTKKPTKSGGFRLDNIQSRREGRDDNGELKKHSLLRKGIEKSPGMRALIDQAVMRGLKLRYEETVFIDDVELWKACVEEAGADCLSQNYFSLDAVTEVNGQIIEIDGESNHYGPGGEQKPNDVARDLYLMKRYGAKVHRFKSYHKNPEVNFSTIKNDILTLPDTGSPWLKGYDEAIWESFYKRDITTRRAIDLLLEGKEGCKDWKVNERVQEILRMIEKEEE